MGDPPAPPPAPETWYKPDWRDRVATREGKLDDSIKKRLERYGSPDALADSLLSLQSRIGSGEFRSVLPKDANDAQIKAWRAENGVPEAPERYELKLKDGLVVGEADKPIIDGFLKDAHGANLTAQQASAAVDWYYNEIERQTQAKADQDKGYAQEAHDALITEWGTDYRGNTNRIEGLLDAAPAGVKERFKFGRLADGRPIMSDAPTLRWLNQLAREINPVTTVIPNAGGNMAGAIDDEIGAIEKNMKAPKGSPDYKAYWEGAAGEKAQARLRELYEARDRTASKGQK